VLIHGGPVVTADLASYCSQFVPGPTSILTPQVGQTVNVTEATDLYRVRLFSASLADVSKLHLKSNFFESLNFVPVSGRSFIAYVDGIVMIPPQEKGS
jgi:hypothetical protein